MWRKMQLMDNEQLAIECANEKCYVRSEIMWYQYLIFDWTAWDKRHFVPFFFLISTMLQSWNPRPSCLVATFYVGWQSSVSETTSKKKTIYCIVWFEQIFVVNLAHAYKVKTLVVVKRTNGSGNYTSDHMSHLESWKAFIFACHLATEQCTTIHALFAFCIVLLKVRSRYSKCDCTHAQTCRAWRLGRCV